MRKKPYIPHRRNVYLLLAVFFVLQMAILPRSTKFPYDYKKGSAWQYGTLISEFDFPILKTEEQLYAEREAAGSKVVPYYKLDEDVSQTAGLAAVRLELGDYDYLIPNISKALGFIYGRGVIEDVYYPSADNTLFLTSSVIFVQKDKRAVQTATSETYSETSAKARLLSSLQAAHPEVNMDSLLTSAAVFDLVNANLKYDKDATELTLASSADYISPTSGVVSAGDLIVSEGEIVTAEIVQVLDSYREEYEQSLGYGGPKVLMWVGNALIALTLCVILFLSVAFTSGEIFEDLRRWIYLLFIVLFAAAMALGIERTDPALLYMTPFSLIALLQMAFFKKRVVMPVYILSLLPLLVFAHSGMELFMIHLTGGLVSILVFEGYSRGWKQFLYAIILFGTLGLAYLGFRFVNDSSVDWMKLAYLFVGSFLCVLGYPLIYLFEKIFGLVSGSRLAELCDTNGNKLLQEFAQKAPGSFQHSLQVMNMADAVAGRIDANVLLTRAGALYHDIGKMNNPQCFVENQRPEVKYHENLSYEESARLIIRHVEDGLALAEKHGLPDIVSDFIRTHHGTTCTMYFYNKYVNEGGNPENKAPFTYPGPRPWTKEQTIVMLCDTLEAASRTLKDNSPDTYDKFVENIVSSKMRDGQLDNSEISLAELQTAKEELKTYLTQLYHERIVYPKRKK